MVKKYTDKHAVRIVREEDKKDLIAFFEAIKSVCNDHCWESAHIEIGELWFIDNYGSLACFDPIDDLSDYTILEGIPIDWREELDNEKVEKSNNRVNQIATNSTFADPLSEHEAAHLNKVRDLQLKVNELTDVLKDIISLHEECGVKPLFAKSIQKAKKLLNQ